MQSGTGGPPLLIEPARVLYQANKTHDSVNTSLVLAKWLIHNESIIYLFEVKAPLSKKCRLDKKYVSECINWVILVSYSSNPSPSY